MLSFGRVLGRRQLSTEGDLSDKMQNKRKKARERKKERKIEREREREREKAHAGLLCDCARA